MNGERNLMVIVDDFGQCFRVSLIADMPSYKPGQFSDTCARTRLGHFAQTQVGSISKNGRQQQYWILCWIGGLEMNEMASETCPVVHFHQQVWDFYMREHPIEQIFQSIRFLRDIVLNRTDLETGTVQFHIR